MAKPKPKAYPSNKDEIERRSPDKKRKPRKSTRKGGRK